jgi:hypothetical protein
MTVVKKYEQAGKPAVDYSGIVAEYERDLRNCALQVHLRKVELESLTKKTVGAIYNECYFEKVKADFEYWIIALAKESNGENRPYRIRFFVKQWTKAGDLCMSLIALRDAFFNHSVAYWEYQKVYCESGLNMPGYVEATEADLQERFNQAERRLALIHKTFNPDKLDFQDGNVKLDGSLWPREAQGSAGKLA